MAPYDDPVPAGFDGLSVSLLLEAGGAPEPSSVEQLYAAAAALPPLREPPSVAALFAGVYAASLSAEGLRIACARDGDRLVGIAYGHRWRWADQRYPWADQLRERLGPEAAAVADGAFVLSLLAVHPDVQRRALGRRLLHTAVPDGDLAWLVTTDVDSPARALYAAEGWTRLGWGPDAPDGRPGLVLVRTG